MSFDEIMLEMYAEAEKLAIADAERILIEEKDFRGLEKLEELKNGK